MARKRNKYYGTYDIYNEKIRRAYFLLCNDEETAKAYSTHAQLYVVIKCSGRKDGDDILKSIGLLSEHRSLLNYNNSTETGNKETIEACDRSTVGVALQPLHALNRMITWEEIQEYLSNHDV